MTMKRFSTTKAHLVNPALRIDSAINSLTAENMEKNQKLIQTIIETVMYCARKQIAM